MVFKSNIRQIFYNIAGCSLTSTPSTPSTHPIVPFLLSGKPTLYMTRENLTIGFPYIFPREPTSKKTKWKRMIKWRIDKVWSSMQDFPITLVLISWNSTMCSLSKIKDQWKVPSEMEVDEWMDGWIRTMVHSLLIQDSPIVPREFSKISIAIKIWHIEHPYSYFKSHYRLVQLLPLLPHCFKMASKKNLSLI